MTARGGKTQDPWGKRALYWVPTGGEGSERTVLTGSTVALPVGKRALYSGARPERDSLAETSENPIVGHGAFVVHCERCEQTSYVGVLDLLIFQLPIGVWLPRGRFDRRMTCPACRRRSWCSLSLRRS